MSNLLYWVKGLGIAISGAVVLSTNSAIAQISQDATLQDNLNTSNFSSTVLEKHNISGNALKFNNTIDQTAIPDRDSVEKKKLNSFTQVIPDKKNVLLAECDWCPCCGCCER
ncbi:hypothetical protein [Nostoc sp.]|uniref:hypothetical protein n=1 Tax=Nostoc sp. TaxID=1180 RepID=UPI002FFCAF82